MSTLIQKAIYFDAIYKANIETQLNDLGHLDSLFDNFIKQILSKKESGNLFHLGFADRDLLFSLRIQVMKRFNEVDLDINDEIVDFTNTFKGFDTEEINRLIESTIKIYQLLATEEKIKILSSIIIVKEIKNLTYIEYLNHFLESKNPELISLIDSSLESEYYLLVYLFFRLEEINLTQDDLNTLKDKLGSSFIQLTYSMKELGLLQPKKEIFN